MHQDQITPYVAQNGSYEFPVLHYLLLIQLFYIACMWAVPLLLLTMCGNKGQCNTW